MRKCNKINTQCEHENILRCNERSIARKKRDCQKEVQILLTILSYATEEVTIGRVTQAQCIVSIQGDSKHTTHNIHNTYSWRPNIHPRTLFDQYSVPSGYV